MRSAPGLADADQDPARERDLELTREPHRLEPTGWHLVRGRPVRPAARCEPLRGRLEHDPHRRGDRPQRGELVSRHHARVEVRQQARLVEHAAGEAREVLEGGRATERHELVARHAIARLGPVAEREERLAAAGLHPGPGDGEHLVLGEERTLAAPRRPGERAVAADVAAERRQGHEHLGRVRHQRARAVRAQAPGLGHELVERSVREVPPIETHRGTPDGLGDTSGRRRPALPAGRRQRPRPSGGVARSSGRSAIGVWVVRRAVSSRRRREHTQQSRGRIG